MERMEKNGEENIKKFVRSHAANFHHHAYLAAFLAFSSFLF
jgi:hypothetical protein